MRIVSKPCTRSDLNGPNASHGDFALFVFGLDENETGAAVQMLTTAHHRCSDSGMAHISTLRPLFSFACATPVSVRCKVLSSKLRTSPFNFHFKFGRPWGR